MSRRKRRTVWAVFYQLDWSTLGEFFVQQVTAVSSQSANSSCSVEDSVEVLPHPDQPSISNIVQVLSVIRYNKLKMSAPPSTMHSISGSDTASIMSQVPALPAHFVQRLYQLTGNTVPQIGLTNHDH